VTGSRFSNLLSNRKSGPIVSKIGLSPFYDFASLALLCSLKLQFFCGLTLKCIDHCRDPKRHFLVQILINWYIARWSWSSRLCCRRRQEEKEREREGIPVPKVTKSSYFTYLWSSPILRSQRYGRMVNVIICANVDLGFPGVQNVYGHRTAVLWYRSFCILYNNLIPYILSHYALRYVGFSVFHLCYHYLLPFIRPFRLCVTDAAAVAMAALMVSYITVTMFTNRRANRNAVYGL